MTGLRFPKPAPRLLQQRARAADLARRDRAESDQVHARSGGRCEVIVHTPMVLAGLGRVTVPVQCPRRAAPGNHHLLGGFGRRNRGRSILAAHRLAVCARCHQNITGHVLVPCGTPAERESAYRVTYREVST
ncbi:MAG: hypothetical protein NTY02_19470 [Acidobacteria bacterium]|nr:hypothetical protein [Acidobacteriota bacterium]